MFVEIFPRPRVCCLIFLFAFLAGAFPSPGVAASAEGLAGTAKSVGTGTEAFIIDLGHKSGYIIKPDVSLDNNSNTNNNTSGTYNVTGDITTTTGDTLNVTGDITTNTDDILTDTDVTSINITNSDVTTTTNNNNSNSNSGTFNIIGDTDNFDIDFHNTNDVTPILPYNIPNSDVTTTFSVGAIVTMGASTTTSSRGGANATSYDTNNNLDVFLSGGQTATFDGSNTSTSTNDTNNNYTRSPSPVKLGFNVLTALDQAEADLLSIVAALKAPTKSDLNPQAVNRALQAVGDNILQHSNAATATVAGNLYQASGSSIGSFDFRVNLSSGDISKARMNASDQNNLWIGAANQGGRVDLSGGTGKLSGNAFSVGGLTGNLIDKGGTMLGKAVGSLSGKATDGFQGLNNNSIRDGQYTIKDSGGAGIGSGTITGGRVN